MEIFITGGTGFVGQHLCRHFLTGGHHVTLTGTRAAPATAADERCRYIQADTARPGNWQAEVGRSDLVVNLAGRTIFQRWTRRYKQQIRDSRVLTTRNVVDALGEETRAVLISASAVGFYGNDPDTVLTETAPAGDDFLAEVAQAWEAEALRATGKGARVALTRFGIILGAEGGALASMLPAFRRFAGGPVGSGKQWLPWIHIADVLAAITYLADHPELDGAFNLCSPEPVRNRELAKTLGAVIGRPAVVPAPALALKLILGGELAEVLLSGQRAVPARLLEAGFQFKYTDLESALTDLLA